MPCLIDPIQMYIVIVMGLLACWFVDLHLLHELYS